MNDDYDVVVVGGGLAAVSAAKWAVESGANVALVTRGWLGSIGVRGSGASSCGATEHGAPSFNRLTDCSFDPDEFQQKIINAGLGLISREKVRLFVEEFVKLQPQAKEVASLYNQPGPYTLGTPLIHHYLAQIKDKITTIPHTTVARILVHDGVCGGICCIHEKSGETFSLRAKAVILAAGGSAGLFSTHVHPECVSGDGYVLGLLAGAKLVNLEFMQIFSMTTAPTRNLIHFWKPEFLHSVKNAHGEAFIVNYLPQGISLEQCIQENMLHNPFSVRDEASRYLGIGITKEIQAGRGSPAGGVYIDLRNCPSFIASRQYYFLRYRGIDAVRIPLEVSMGFQCCNGGLVVDNDMATETVGLYAAGENAGGFHGADRLGGNMLSGCVISGKLAGQAAAAYSRKATMLSSIEEPKIVSLLGNQPHITPDQRGAYQQMIQEIREMAQNQLLLIKSREGLEKTRQKLDDLTVKAVVVAGSPKQLPIELENMLLLSRALWLATTSREESRGGFYREDFPGPNLTTKPKTHIVSLEQSGNIKLANVIADPEWDPDYQNKLTNKRWG